MKYIKTYEDYQPTIEPRYNILKGNNETMVKVIDYDEFDTDGLPYYVEFVDGELSWLPGNKFERNMTEKEIKEFEEKLELVKTAKKYNL